MTAPTARWAPVVAYCAVAAVTQMVWLTFAPVTTSAATYYGVSDTDIGWLAQPFVLLYVLVAVPAGVLLDRGFRSWLAVGALLTAAGALLRTVGDGYGWLMAGAVVAAVAQPFVLNAVTGVAAQYLPESRRPLGISLASASLFAGMVLSFAIGIAFTDMIGTLVLLEAVIATVAALGLVIALRTPPPFRSGHPPAGVGQFRAAWSIPLIRLLCLFIFLPYGTFIALTTWSQTLLEPAGVDADQAGIALIAMVLAGVVGSATIPVWSARARAEVRVMGAAVVVSAAACLVLAAVPGFVTAVVCLTVLGLVSLSVLPIVLELTERASDQAEGTAAGLVLLAGNLSGLVVATVVGFTTGMPPLAFALLAAATLVSLLVLSRLRGPVAELAPVGGGAPEAP